MSKFVLIDGHSILNRAFYGVPIFTNSEGLHTNAVFGFLNIMFKIIDSKQPDIQGTGTEYAIIQNSRITWLLLLTFISLHSDTKCLRITKAQESL